MNVTRIFDLLPFYAEKFGDRREMLAGKEKDGWKKYSASEVIERVEALACGLAASGIRPGDRVGLIAGNRPEWTITDFAVQLAGAVLVPIYPTVSDTDLRFIFQDAGLRYAFVSGNDLYKRVQTASEGLEGFSGICSIVEDPGIPCWKDLSALGKSKGDGSVLEHVRSTVQPMDLATILYTSGTTGNPKGVMLSHNNLVSNFTALCELPPVDENGVALSFLPLNHSYERILVYLYLLRGVPIWYCPNIDQVGDYIREVKPQIFACVPRLLEKVYDRIVGKGSELGVFTRAIFFWSIRLAEQYDPAKKMSWYFRIRHSIADKLVYKKWRSALGGDVRAAVSGGAALNQRLARIFWCADIPVLEGYGLTETSPVIAVNNFEPNSLRMGTVGPVIQGVQVKIAEDGEILVKGPNVMMGYYNRPDATAEVIDPEGWFHTGDIGVFVEDRFLKITDRKKEIFKTSGGKYISPQAIENQLKTSRFIEQAMVLGENKKYAAALIVPAFDFVKEWGAKHNLKLGSREEIAAHPEVIKRITEEVQRINKDLAHYETIKKIQLLPREWTIADGEMTPKLSLKRKVIMKTYESLIAKLFPADEA